MQPELLVNLNISDEYIDQAIQISLEDLEEVLIKKPGVFLNAYAQGYGILIKEFPYAARNGFFINAEKRIATHRFESKGIARRDGFFEDADLIQLIPEIYKKNWFDIKDAIRCYSILITKIEKLDTPIPVGNFGLWNSWGKVAPRDRFNRPRLIKPNHGYS
jgi:hypothetical protein